MTSISRRITCKREGNRIHSLYVSHLTQSSSADRSMPHHLADYSTTALGYSVEFFLWFHASGVIQPVTLQCAVQPHATVSKPVWLWLYGQVAPEHPIGRQQREPPLVGGTYPGGRSTLDLHSPGSDATDAPPHSENLRGRSIKIRHLANANAQARTTRGQATWSLLLAARLAYQILLAAETWTVSFARSELRSVCNSFRATSQSK